MSQTGKLVYEAFCQACNGFEVTDAGINKAWFEIEKAYTSPGRFYHTLDHLETMRSWLTKLRPEIIDFEATIFALVYHDFIYRPLKSNNEERSADHAAARLTEMNISSKVCDRVRNLILCTKAHQTGKNDDENLFIDADLSILGSHPKQYQEYSKNVRREYRFVPDLIFNPGRRKILENFLKMPAIYKTPYFKSKLELTARENMSEELKTLK